MITPGDVTGDGRPTSWGARPPASSTYQGTGVGTATATGYATGPFVSTGWQAYNTVFSTG